MPIDPADYEYQDPNPYSNPLDNAQEDREWFDSTTKKTPMQDNPHHQPYKPDPSDSPASDSFMDEAPMLMNSSNKSANPIFMMMVILQIRSVVNGMKKYGVPISTLRTALYTLLRIDLSEKVSDQVPGTIESFQLALEDVKNFNDVADKLFEAYAKDRSICRDGLTTVLTGDNFSITLNMSCPNSDSNATGQSSKSNKSS